MKEETRHWVDLADADLAAAKVLLKEGLHAPSVFHCQQAIEKLLKAIWAETKGETPPRTHNLIDLAKELDLLPDGWRPFLADLTNQAVATRYAGRGIYPEHVAKQYFLETEKICEQLRQRLK